MAYKKQTCVDDETVGTADRFNHMEEGIVEASKTGGVEVGTIVYIEDNAPVPEGYELIDNNEIYADLGSEGWKQATLNAQFYSNGSVRYIQIGKVVIVDFNDLVLKADMSGDQLIASGLPPASELGIFLINGTNGGATKSNHRMSINTVGNVGNWYDTKGADASMYYYGQLIYLTN